MHHLSLFSGIGGFDLAAEWMGWVNVAQVEKDPFCLKVLEKNFPNTKRYHDIKEFDGTDYAGRVDIITGGFPCQPFSQAGARRGTGDDRHLWPEMLRVISTIKPTWVIAENVRGLLSIEQGMVFEQVCLDLENIGYEVQPVIIPAVAVNAPHRRDRVWFIGYSHKNQLNRSKSRGVAEESRQTPRIGEDNNTAGQPSGADQLLPSNGQPDRHEYDATDTRHSPERGESQSKWTSGELTRCDKKDASNSRCERQTFDEEQTAGIEQRNQDAANSECTRHQRETHQERQSSRCDSRVEQWNRDWPEVAAELCGVDDGLPVELGEFKLSKAGHRNHQIKAYGNAIVPQVAFEIFRSLTP